MFSLLVACELIEDILEKICFKKITRVKTHTGDIIAIIIFIVIYGIF